MHVSCFVITFSRVENFEKILSSKLEGKDRQASSSGTSFQRINRKKNWSFNSSVTNITALVNSMPPHGYDFSDMSKNNLARPFHFNLSFKALCAQQMHDDSLNYEKIISNVSKKEKCSGLLYNKMPKAASSTTSGVALRIADRHFCIRHHFQLQNSTLTKSRENETCIRRVHVDHVRDLVQVSLLVAGEEMALPFFFPPCATQLIEPWAGYISAMCHSIGVYLATPIYWSGWGRAPIHRLVP